MKDSDSRKRLNLKAGEWVEVRTQAEILATLDERGRLGNLPFMPEMLQYCGKRFRVFKRADKTCDPAHDPWSIRRLENTVHLEGVRCDGQGHDGCQAGCLIFWNESWLRRAESNVLSVESLQRSDVPAARSDARCTLKTIATASQKTNPDGETVYSCQATDLRDFTAPMAEWDPRQYIRDLSSGNLASGLAGDSAGHRALDLVLGALRLIRALIIIVFNNRIPGRYTGGMYPLVAGTLERTPSESLDLQPGELVQVRSKEEIVATLDQNNRNRGMLFDVEMVPYCGGIYRVLRRVHHIIDDRTARMINLRNPCIVLEGVVCQSDFHRLCPRAIYPYWRENWLKRAANVSTPVSAPETAGAFKE